MYKNGILCHQKSYSKTSVFLCMKNVLLSSIPLFIEFHSFTYSNIFIFGPACIGSVQFSVLPYITTFTVSVFTLNYA